VHRLLQAQREYRPRRKRERSRSTCPLSKRNKITYDDFFQDQNGTRSQSLNGWSSNKSCSSCSTTRIPLLRANIIRALIIGIRCPNMFNSCAISVWMTVCARTKKLAIQIWLYAALSSLVILRSATAMVETLKEQQNKIL
jgi:hypothetical protein